MTPNQKLKKMKNKDYSVLANDDVFDFNISDLETLDIINNQNGSFHCLVDNNKYEIEMVSLNGDGKNMSLKINGNQFDIKIKDQFDLLIDKMGLVSSDIVDIKNVLAPMPGLVLGIQIKSGDQVMKGDTLLVLEAMKMENMIKSPVDGVIKKLSVASGDAVDKGQILVEFD